MPQTLPIQGEYPADWPQINARVCEAAGHRCIRCHHPYTKGTHERGEWSPCDLKCRHGGPLAELWTDGSVHLDSSNRTAAQLVAQNYPPECRVVAQWRILTVHHFDGNKANCEWWNLLALCQRCHLHTQARVNPQQPYMLEHSDWLKPYVAGFYAQKYEAKNLTREEVMKRLDELLSLERIA